ncbi:hypothetical protein GCM10027080_25280 [Pedococcus soli]
MCGLLSGVCQVPTAWAGNDLRWLSECTSRTGQARFRTSSEKSCSTTRFMAEVPAWKTWVPINSAAQWPAVRPVLDGGVEVRAGGRGPLRVIKSLWIVLRDVLRNALRTGPLFARSDELRPGTEMGQVKHNEGVGSCLEAELACWWALWG